MKNWKRPRKGLIAAGVLISLLGLTGLVACRPPVEPIEHPDAILVRLEGGIGGFWEEKIKAEIDEAIEREVPVFIIEFDTPGGYLDQSWDLADHIFERGKQITVVAYVRSMALSGGTLVALACDSIYLHEKTGRIGDVAPVDPTGKIVGEKVQSPVRERMETYARGRYPIALVQAMVTKEREVFALKEAMVEEGKEPETIYVTGETLKTMTSAQLAGYGPPQLIVGKTDLLTVGAKRAEELGLGTSVEDEEDLFARLGLASDLVERHVLSQSERIIAWLDMLSPLLITAGIVLLFIELSHPGFGLPGIAGIACFVVFFIVKMSLRDAHMLEVILFVLGLSLLMVEVFVIPGFGLVGAGGILLIFVSLVLASLPFTFPTKPPEFRIFTSSVIKVFGSFVAAGVIMAVMLRFLPRMPVFSRLVQDYNLSEARAGDVQAKRVPQLAEMVGRRGTALSALRPAGRAEFDDVLLDVVTAGEFIEKGSRICILEIHGSRVVVEAQRES